MTLADAWKLVRQRGPTAMLIDRDGTLVPWDLAKRQGHVARCGLGDRYDEGSVEWDMLYIRHDGFSVASDVYNGHHIEKLFPGQWIGTHRRGDKVPKPLDRPEPASV